MSGSRHEKKRADAGLVNTTCEQGTAHERHRFVFLLCNLCFKNVLPCSIEAGVRKSGDLTHFLKADTASPTARENGAIIKFHVLALPPQQQHPEQEQERESKRERARESKRERARERERERERARERERENRQR